MGGIENFVDWTVFRSFLSNFFFSIEFVFFIWLVLLVWFRDRKGWLWFWVVIWLVVFMSPLSTWLVYDLERTHLPISQEVPDTCTKIVVLGSGGTPESHLPPVQQLGEAVLHRVLEGIRIWKTNPDRFLVFSSRGREGYPSQASMYSQVALELGVPEPKILLMEEGYTTETEVQDFIALFPKEKEIILVTSASHMPRAIALFAAYGVDAYPAPTHYTVKTHPGGRRLNFMPSFSALEKWNILMHEYVGRLWIKIKFEIPPLWPLNFGEGVKLEEDQSTVKQR